MKSGQAIFQKKHLPCQALRGRTEHFPPMLGPDFLEMIKVSIYFFQRNAGTELVLRNITLLAKVSCETFPLQPVTFPHLLHIPTFLPVSLESYI